MRAWLLVAVLSISRAQGGADEQYAYVAGLADKGLHDRVVKEAESFLREHASHPKAELARYRLACALFELDRTADAVLHFRELATRGDFPFAAEVQLRLGQCELGAGRCDPAAKAFARALEARKDYLAVPATALLAEAHFRCERWAEAEAAWTALLARPPAAKPDSALTGFLEDAACGLAWCAYRSGRLDLAAERIEEALRRLARDGAQRASEMRFLLGECRLDAGRREEALAAYRLVRDGPFADAARRGAGFALAGLGDHAAAAREFAAVLADHPQSRFAAECALHAGIETLLAGDAAGARARLESKEVGLSAEALLWRARAQSRTGAGTEALASLDRAASAKPSKELAAEIEIARGDVLAALGRNEEAAEAWRRSGSDYALQAAAVASLNEKRPEDAVRLARELLAKHPQSKYKVEAGLALGEGLFATADYAGAEAAFAAALEADRDDARRVRSRSRIAWCRYLRKDLAGAAELFGALAAEHAAAPEAEEAAFMEGRARESFGDEPGAGRAYGGYLERFENGPHADEALLRLVRLVPELDANDLLEEALAARPDSAFADEIRFELGERLSAAGRFDPARAHYAELIGRDAGSALAPAARYGLAWCEFQLGRHGAASQALAPLLAGRSTSPELAAGAAELGLWIAAKQEDPDALVASWRAFSAVCSDEARLLRAAKSAVLALSKSGRGAEAQALLASLAKKAREPAISAAVAVESAYLWIDEGKLDQAERELERAERAAPQEVAVAEAFFHAGEARFAAGEDERASGLYAKSARNASSPVADRALYKDGFARLRSGDAAGAERCFAALVEGHPSSELLHETLFLLGEARFRAGRHEEAIASLERVIREAPRHAVRPKALFRLGLALGARERWAESAEVLATLAREFPAFENANEAELARGRALARQGDLRAARSALERVVANDRGELSGRARLELGRLHESAGDSDPALSEYLKVAVLYAEPELVGEALLCAGRVLEAQGDLERARQQYEEILEKHANTSAATAARERLRATAKR